jgi:hypothetical protein
MKSQVIMTGTGKNDLSQESQFKVSLQKPTPIIAFIQIFILLFFSLGTINRNTVRKDDITLWSDTVKESPVSTSSHHNLGLAYKLQGQLEMAVAEFQAASRLKPGYYEARQHLSDIVSRQH